MRINKTPKGPKIPIIKVFKKLTAILIPTYEPRKLNPSKAINPSKLFIIHLNIAFIGVLKRPKDIKDIIITII